MWDYTGKLIYVGIDVHKDSYSITVVCDQTIVKQDKLIALPEKLVEYLKRFKGAMIKSAYEAGFCGFHLHRFLMANNIDNIVVNPASIEISSRDSVKTDKRDSLKIAEQLSSKRLQCVYIPSEEKEDKRHLTRLRENFVKQRNRVSCQIKSLLHLNGLIPPRSSPRVCDKWIKSILENELKRNCHFTLEKLFLSWRFYGLQINSVNKQIEAELGEDKGLEKIYCSAPGIGPTSARKLVNELGDMSQFSNQEKLFCYIGVTPREYSSGENTRQGHITRQGKPILRRILIEAAWVAIRRDYSLTLMFEKLARRVGKKRAIVAIARTLIGRIRTCIKEKRLYVIQQKEKVKTAA